MHTTSIRAALAALLLACIVPAAQAGRPLQTEDAGILDRGDCEVEAVSSRWSGGGEPRMREHSVQVGCGVGGSTQLALATARSRDGESRADALALVGKTALREFTETQAGVVVAYRLAGARAKGGSFKHEATELRAVLSAALAADWLVHGNLGAARDEAAKQTSTIWSAALERTGVGPFDLLAEFFGDDRAAPWWNTGLRYTAIAQRLFFDASYGAQLRGGRPKLLTVGLKFAF